MNVSELLDQARDTITVKRVFGEPYEHNGVTIVPVASVGGGGGGGSGEQEGGQQGQGLGFGVIAKPAGVYVISGDDVRWQPAVDINRIVLGGQIVAIACLFVVRSILRARRR
jgi:uncharacterized spore protein YtfJ